MTETPAELNAAVAEQRRAAAVAAAFQMPALPQGQRDALQNAMRTAWAVDAHKAGQRLGRIAMVGAEAEKTGSRGNAGKRRDPINLVQAKARAEKMAKLLRAQPRTRLELADAMGLEPARIDSILDRLRGDGRLTRVRKDGPYVVYGVNA